MKLKKIVFLLLVLIIISGCKSNNLNNTNKEKKYNNEIIKLNKKGDLEKIVDGYIFFSTTDCFLCEEIYPLVKEEIKKYEFNLYYFDIKKMLDDKIYTSEELLDIFNKYYIKYTPTIIKIKNGNEISRYPSDYNQEIEELSNELKNFFEER